MTLTTDPLAARLGTAVAAVLRRPGDPLTELAELGLFGLDLPAAAGGLDLGVGAAVVAGTELGRALQPLPGYHDTVHAAHLLHGCRPPHPVGDLLTAAAAGSRLVAVVDGGVRLDPSGRLHGRSVPLHDARWDAALVRGAGPVLALVELSGDGASVEDSRLVLTGATPLAVRPAGDCRRADDAALLRQAAFLLGVAGTALTAAVDHTNTRRQFDRPLIEFQTVRHRLAAVQAEAEGLALLVGDAARRHDAGLAAAHDAVQAMAAAADHALATTRLAVQLHGARGIVEGGVPERAYRLAGAASVRYGRPHALWHRAGLLRIAGQPARSAAGPAVRSAANRASSAAGGSRNV